jgi:single-stranded DNA-binding protein
MARSINQVILMGRLTRDPEQRTTSTGKTIASFSIAVDRGGESDAADFFEVTAWEKLGDLVIQYLAKGRSRVEVTATDVTFLDGPSDGAGSNQPSGSSNAAQKNDDVVIEDIDDKPIDLSEIPF